MWPRDAVRASGLQASVPPRYVPLAELGGILFRVSIPFVIPAKAGTQPKKQEVVPAFAGMTMVVASGCDRCHCGLSRPRSPRRRGPGPAFRGLAALHRRGPSRQGGRGEPRARPRRTVVDRLGASAQGHHGQPVAGRPSQGGVALRPADRARAARGDRGDGCRDPVAICRRRRTLPRRAHRRLAGRAARGDPRLIDG